MSGSSVAEVVAAMPRCLPTRLQSWRPIVIGSIYAPLHNGAGERAAGPERTVVVVQIIEVRVSDVRI